MRPEHAFRWLKPDRADLRHDLLPERIPAISLCYTDAFGDGCSIGARSMSDGSHRWPEIV